MECLSILMHQSSHHIRQQQHHQYHIYSISSALYCLRALCINSAEQYTYNSPSLPGYPTVDYLFSSLINELCQYSQQC